MSTPRTPKETSVPTRPATPRQLSYLKSLATRCGQTFTYPHTAAEAGREINRLKTATATSRTERYVERKAIADQIATGPIHDATRVQEDEISGRGRSATWTQNRDQEPTVFEPAPAPRRTPPNVGARAALGRYRTTEGERIVYGQRIDGVVRVTDRPAGPGGRSYLVERGLETHDELTALVAEYLAHGEKLGHPPMSIDPLGSELQAAA
jgi:hypothetical protein